ncbi:hypothetical protein L873DRAFT_1787472 [Choiromyces venosus 120613-1]|uniref:Uncharacterized protein n=1 Tax=Choiromyces venosus 120613-1 TaxID=1336337 RepID=A0A3N4K2Y3_9PEZI|nr:hypothetical protein L873DRAFT_1787472 [Choiromyces venosus 120613-1]
MTVIQRRRRQTRTETTVEERTCYEDEEGDAGEKSKVEDKEKKEDIEEGDGNGEDEKEEDRGGVVKNSFSAPGQRQSMEIEMLEIRDQLCSSISQVRGKSSQRPTHHQRMRNPISKDRVT